MTDLSLLSTEALLEELKRRYEVLVVGGLLKWAVGEEAKHYLVAGDCMKAVGLCHRMAHRMQRELDEEEREEVG